MRIVGLGVAMAIVAAAPRARARETDLAVTRGAGAEACPDAAQLLRLARSSATPEHAYRVTFTRGETYRVEIVDATSNRTRRLDDTGASCGPLAQAAAVVLATMWGSEARREEDDAQTAPEPPPEPALPPLEQAAPPPAPPLPVRAFVAAGGGIADGIVRPAAPAVLVDAGLERGHASFALGGLWLPRQRLDLPPGAVDVQLLAASARACAFLWDRTRLVACARFFGGGLSASARGFSVDDAATRPWLAMGAELFVSGTLAWPLRYRAAVVAIIPAHQETFAVSNAGVAYETPPFGALLTLSIEAATR